jgi:signal transduction histidine kinase
MPIDFSKVSSHVAAALQRSGAQLSAATSKGYRKGQMLTAAPAGAARQAMRTPEAEKKTLKTIDRPVSSHSVVVQQTFRPLTPAEATRRLQQMRLKQSAVKASARAIVRRRSIPKPGEGKSPQESEELFMAQQLAAAAQAPGVSAHEATALLTPVGGEVHTKEQLCELLREKLAENDDESFDDFLKDMLSGPDGEPLDEEERAELALALRHAQNNDDALMDLLRDAQELPFGKEEDEQELDRLRDKIHEAIQEFEAESTGKGQEVLIGFNIAPVSSGAADPEAFKQAYLEIVATSRSFAATLKVLVTRFTPEMLGEIVPQMQKALAADMEAATPSHDLRRLWAVVDKIGNMTLSRTFLEMVNELVGQIRRLPEETRGEEPWLQATSP